MEEHHIYIFFNFNSLAAVQTASAYPNYFWAATSKLIIKSVHSVLRGGYSLDMMCLTLLLSTHSHPCLASLVDVTVSPTGTREREKERDGS